MVLIPKDYLQQLSLNDPNGIGEFIELIREIVQQEIKFAKFNRKLPATIASVGVGVADIKILDSDNVITNVKNRTGQTLNVGDEVYIELINGSTNNIYIDIKK